MSDPSKPPNRLEQPLRCFALFAGSVAAGIGAVHLIAWWSGAMVHRGLQSITMKTNAALGLVLCGVALAMLASRFQGRLVRSLSYLFPALALLIGTLTILEHLLGWDLGIDQLLAQEPPGALGVVFPNRMGPPGAVSLVLGGTALLLLARRSESCWQFAQRLAIIFCLVPLLGLIGYIFGV